MRLAIDLPPGVVSDDTTFAAAGRWADSNNVRFWRGRAQVIGGWSAAFSDTLTGVCRSILAYTDASFALRMAFGTSSLLQMFAGGAVYDITPYIPPTTLTANPLATTSGSANVVVTHVGHGLLTGEQVTISGATAVGGITPNGTYTITKLTDDTYRITHGSNASSTTTGGGSAVVIQPLVPVRAGNIDSSGSEGGYGTGTYGTGTYSTAQAATNAIRTWSLAAWGNTLLASPRGGAIFNWTGVVTNRAAAIANAPQTVTYMMVAPQDQVFALGCNEESSGVFNPLCIRHSGVRNLTEWTTSPSTTSREYILPGGGRIVAGRVVGPYLLVWTTDALFLGTYVGAIDQIWRFDRVGERCGLIGPNAAVVVGQTAYWMGPDYQFRSYQLGGIPNIVECPIREDMADNIDPAQVDKVVASSISAYNEVRFDYPDRRDGDENSRYIAVGLFDGSWYRGRMERTAMIDAGPSEYPIGTDSSGRAYWHEYGQSANGSALSWSVKTADMYLDEEYTMLVRGLWPDMEEQAGAMTVTLYARSKPQGADRSQSQVLAPSQDKADYRLKGRLFAVEYSGSSSPAAARLGKPVFDLQQTGKR